MRSGTSIFPNSHRAASPALCGPADLFPRQQSDLISTSGGTMSGRPCTQPLPRSLYQCPVIKMSPFHFRAIASPLGGIFAPIKSAIEMLFSLETKKKDPEKAFK